MNVTEKSYDHRNKVGNQGDLIKHFALFQIASSINRREGSPFIYVEAHAGRPRYQLSRRNLSKGWKQGVGSLVDRLHEMTNTDDVSEINKFVAFIEQGYSDEQIDYLGSSTLVSEVLKERLIPVKSILFDLNPDVCNALNEDGDKSITVYCKSSYDGVRELSKIDLLFIDPPDLYPSDEGHANRYKSLLYHCADNHIPFVSWNPLYSNKRLNGPSLECSMVNEYALQKGYSIITVRWSDWGEKMCGCQMLFNLPNGESYAESCLNLATLMGWVLYSTNA